jgi:arylsulfatase A-like enzyme
MVVVTADHGEEFGEHGGFGHGNIFRPITHVPLVILPPGGLKAPLRERRPVSLRNLPATLVDVLGVAEGSPFPGRSLARSWQSPPTRDQAEAIVSDADVSGSDRKLSAGESEGEGDGAEADLVLSEIVDRQLQDPETWVFPRALIAEGKSYLRHGNGHEQLFDLDADSDQGHDLAAEAEAVPILERFRERLSRLESPANGEQVDR